MYTVYRIHEPLGVAGIIAYSISIDIKEKKYSVLKIVQSEYEAIKYISEINSKNKQKS